MSGNITWEIALLIVAAIGSGLGVWLRIEGRIKLAETEAKREITYVEKKCLQVERALQDLKLEILKDFASVSHLEKVEDRLISAIRELTAEVKHLREFYTSDEGKSRSSQSRKRET